jgi:S-adenosylmethionine synthetase
MSRNGRYLFTSESVTEGHPDKIADQISDSVLDTILAQDPMAWVACETPDDRSRDHRGETHQLHLDFQKVVRDTISDVGYTKSGMARRRYVRRAVLDPRQSPTS